MMEGWPRAVCLWFGDRQLWNLALRGFITHVGSSKQNVMMDGQ